MKFLIVALLSLTLTSAYAQSSSGLKEGPVPKSVNNGDLTGMGATNSGTGTGISGAKKDDSSMKKDKCSGLSGDAQKECMSTHKK